MCSDHKSEHNSSADRPHNTLHEYASSIEPQDHLLLQGDVDLTTAGWCGPHYCRVVVWTSLLQGGVDLTTAGWCGPYYCRVVVWTILLQGGGVDLTTAGWCGPYYCRVVWTILLQGIVRIHTENHSSQL